ncbi:hypothetical protein H6783_01970 [Candidatus Nomurabacteria bacterium]|nr:hypothetical protein [Candidatus Nomurabacteria bacterium]
MFLRRFYQDQRSWLEFEREMHSRYGRLVLFWFGVRMHMWDRWQQLTRPVSRWYWSRHAEFAYRKFVSTHQGRWKQRWVSAEKQYLRACGVVYMSATLAPDAKPNVSAAELVFAHFARQTRHGELKPDLVLEDEG